MESFADKFPPHMVGQLDIFGGQVRKPNQPHEAHYACCEQAVVIPKPCVCFFVSMCPVHGLRHNGTHD